jgi:hypothetical protein
MRIDQGAEHGPDSAAAIDRPRAIEPQLGSVNGAHQKWIEKSCAALDGLPHSISEMSN